jgi:hypothetical protein
MRVRVVRGSGVVVTEGAWHVLEVRATDKEYLRFPVDALRFPDVTRLFRQLDR